MYAVFVRLTLSPCLYWSRHISSSLSLSTAALEVSLLYNPIFPQITFLFRHLTLYQILSIVLNHPCIFSRSSRYIYRTRLFSAEGVFSSGVSDTTIVFNAYVEASITSLSRLRSGYYICQSSPKCRRSFCVCSLYFGADGTIESVRRVC